jgi:hypothetical protein
VSVARRSRCSKGRKGRRGQRPNDIRWTSCRWGG